MYYRIAKILIEKNVIPNTQFGFIPKHSTTHALIRLIEQCVKGINSKQSTIAVFLDIEKAFDTVWIKGLLYKLIKLKFPPFVIQLLQSYLSARKFKVKVGNEFSDVKNASN